MHPIVQALFSSWEWRFEILIVLIPLGVLYTMGWRRLRQRGAKIANRKRLISYWAGLIVLGTALMSPIDYLGGQLFFMHMLQHLLTMMVAAPLLWLADPFPFMLWGLPHRPRAMVAGQFRQGAPVRTVLAYLTAPLAAWMIFLTVYLGWHEPVLYNLALRRSWVHDLQHLTFFLAAMLYWWHVIGAAPKIHSRFPVWGRLGYIMGTIPPNMFAGIAIAFTSTVIYSYYESIPQIWGFTTMQDQMLGGVIMWIPGSMMLLFAALILLATQFKRNEEPLHAADWDTDEAMVAPGLEHRVIQNRWRELEKKTGEASGIQ